MIRALGFGVSNRATKAVWTEHHVRIGEQEPVCSGLLCRAPHGVGLSHPARRQFSDVDNPEIGFRRVRMPVARCGEIVHNLAGPICRPIIDGDDFVVVVIQCE